VTRDLVIVACAISAGIHAALAPEHFRESTGAGVGFLAAAVILAAVAAALTRRPSSAFLLGVAAASFAGLLGSYALAATTGLPLLHPEPEPVTGLALFTKGVEAVGLVAAVSSLTASSPPLLPRLKGTLT
jgi:hypothetical protein